jgi:serine/threonine protein kinase
MDNIGETIGEGGFGFVRKATHLATGQTVAVKICPLSRYDGEQLKAL